MNVAPWDAIDTGPVWFGEPGEQGALRVAEGVQRGADEKARLAWVLWHPYGVDWWSLRAIRVWLIIRVRYLVGRPI